MARGNTPDVSTPIPNAPIAGADKQVVPFRKATYERDSLLQQYAVTPGASQLIAQNDVLGDGYMYAITVDVNCTTAGNGAGTTFTEDGPFSFFQRMQLNDVSGDLHNTSGFETLLGNIMSGQFAVFLPDTAAHSALFTALTGAGATGGSFTFMLRYNIATGTRDLRGAVGNQSRTIKYQETEVISPSASIWGVAPTVIPAITVQRIYTNYAVPNAQNALGIPQQQYPPDYGILHRLTSTTLEAPAASSTVSHFLKQVSNTIRSLGLIFRSGAGATPRATGDTAALAPTQVVLKAGSATVMQTTWRKMKERNLRQFGFDPPAGVIVFDFTHDWDVKAGDEFGDDWLHSQQLSDLHFEITYPAGAWGAGSSLVAVTDELLNVGA